MRPQAYGADVATANSLGDRPAPMTHADLHRLSPDEPVWGLVALLAAHRYTGEVAVATTA